MSTQISVDERSIYLRLQQATREMLLRDTLDERLQVAVHTCRDLGWRYSGIVLNGNTRTSAEAYSATIAEPTFPTIPATLLMNFWTGAFSLTYSLYKNVASYLITLQENAAPVSPNVINDCAPMTTRPQH